MDRKSRDVCPRCKGGSARAVKLATKNGSCYRIMCDYCGIVYPELSAERKDGDGETD